MERIFSAGEGPDGIDLALLFLFAVEGTGLLESPGSQGLFVSAECFELFLGAKESCYSLEIFFLQKESCSRCVAASTAVLAAELFPEKLHTLV